MNPGDRRRFFDSLSEWRVTGDIEDNDIYFLPATVLHIYSEVNGDELANIEFDHKLNKISRGHFIDITRPTYDNMEWTFFFFLMQMCNHIYETSPDYYWDRQHETFV